MERYRKSDGAKGEGVIVKLSVTGITASNEREAKQKSEGPLWDKLQAEARVRTDADPVWRYQGKHIRWPKIKCTP